MHIITIIYIETQIFEIIYFSETQVSHFQFKLVFYKNELNKNTIWQNRKYDTDFIVGRTVFGFICRHRYVGSSQFLRRRIERFVEKISNTVLDSVLQSVWAQYYLVDIERFSTLFLEFVFYRLCKLFLIYAKH